MLTQYTDTQDVIVGKTQTQNRDISFQKQNLARPSCHSAPLEARNDSVILVTDMSPHRGSQTLQRPSCPRSAPSPQHSSQLL